jgi:inosine-uridine nucleoside N-ribohydrolase
MKQLVMTALAVVTLVAAQADSASLKAQERTIPVILSTDTATGLQNGWRTFVSDIDDGLAIAMALASPKLDLRGVVVTYGNNLMEPEYEIARHIVAGMGSDVPVVRGAPMPLPEVEVKLYDGKSVISACLNEGVSFIASKLAESAEPVTILAIGPLTDVACLAQNFHEAVAKIKKVFVIGGRSAGEAFVINGKYLADFNFAKDIPAIQYLLDKTKIPIQFMTFTLTSSLLVPSSDREVLCKSELPLAADFFCPAVEPWIQQWSRIFSQDGFHPWDQNAIYALTNPEAYDCKPSRYAIIDCKAAHCAGHGSDDPAMPVSETAQVWLTPDPEGTRLQMCNSYKPGAQDGFLKTIFAFATDRPVQ